MTDVTELVIDGALTISAVLAAGLVMVGIDMTVNGIKKVRQQARH